ncbi:MAG: type IVB secretion system protein IcmN/DotK [Legionellales bacterium]|nr:type IVB secretion system protein IcmN/DotK [Legionellales bacterium]
MTVLVLLAGCQKTRHIIEPATLPYKVNGASDKAMQAMQARFNHEGIRVVTIGQDYMVSIPSSVLFPNESPRLTWRSYALLNAVACYLREFRKVSVNVTAFSNKCVSVDRDRALTRARARAVGDYLWSQGVDSRFIFTQGLGSDKPIVAYTELGDASPNSRVEITFRDMVM